jgi:hypothetical protein
MSPRQRSPSKTRRPSTAQIIFLALTVIIILSFVLSLFINV